MKKINTIENPYDSLLYFIICFIDFTFEYHHWSCYTLVYADLRRILLSFMVIVNLYVGIHKMEASQGPCPHYKTKHYSKLSMACFHIASGNALQNSLLPKLPQEDCSAAW